jgi:hypothetical protein
MRRIAILATVGVVVVLLVVAQLVLPGIAADRLRDTLSKHGHVAHVEVDAFPAIELLWHRADKVVIRMDSYRSDTGGLGTNLSQTGDAQTLNASASVVDVGLLKLHDASLHKRGNTLTGTARVTEQDLRAAVPFLDSVQPVQSAGGQLTLRGTATLLGITGSVDATVSARDGALIVVPDVPFGALATVTIFRNRHVAVDDVSARPTTDGFVVSARGRLR